MGSTKRYWSVRCRYEELGCLWRLRGRWISDNQWMISKYYERERHTCQNETTSDHCNLDINLIASFLVSHLKEKPDTRVRVRKCYRSC